MRLNEVVCRIRQIGVDLAENEVSLEAGAKQEIYRKIFTPVIPRPTPSKGEKAWRR